MVLNLRIYEQPRIRLIRAEERERKTNVRVTACDLAASIWSRVRAALFATSDQKALMSIRIIPKSAKVHTSTKVRSQYSEFSTLD